MVNKCGVLTPSAAARFAHAQGEHPLSARVGEPSEMEDFLQNNLDLVEVVAPFADPLEFVHKILRAEAVNVDGVAVAALGYLNVSRARIWMVAVGAEIVWPQNPHALAALPKFLKMIESNRQKGVRSAEPPMDHCNV